MKDCTENAPKSIQLEPIGRIHSPFTEQTGTPIQPGLADEALDDLEGFERIWLLFHLDRAKSWQPKIVPYRDREARGLFSTRAPARPNPLGLSVVRLLGRQGPRLIVGGLDILDGTPLFDIKPYVPEFDAFDNSGAGWLDRTRLLDAADGRFSKE